MAKSNYAEAVDEIQVALRSLMKEQDFKRRGRTYNRLTGDDLTQVVNFQMGPSDPPGTTYIPGLRENLYGLFTVNLGVYLPEVARCLGGGEARTWVQDYHCCVRVSVRPQARSETFGGTHVPMTQSWEISAAVLSSGAYRFWLTFPLGTRSWLSGGIDRRTWVPIVNPDGEIIDHELHSPFVYLLALQKGLKTTDKSSRHVSTWGHLFRTSQPR